MKKYLMGSFLFTLFCLYGNKANSQTVDLSLTLAAVQDLQINATTVSIPLTTLAHYQSGNSATVSPQLTFSSVDDYEIKVSAGSDSLELNSSNRIPVNTFTLTPTVVSGTAPSSLNPITLSTTAQILAESTGAGTFGTVLAVEYSASGGSAYLNKDPGTYTVQLTYSINPK